MIEADPIPYGTSHSSALKKGKRRKDEGGCQGKNFSFSDLIPSRQDWMRQNWKRHNHAMSPSTFISQCWVNMLSSKAYSCLVGCGIWTHGGKPSFILNIDEVFFNR